MNKKNSSNIGHNKKSLLNSPVEHIDIKSFDARKIVDGIGVEKSFLLSSPLVKDLEVVKKGKGRRARLNYLRDRKGKAALRVKVDN